MMITKKEDLRKCYVPRCDNEVFELFMDKCEEFDIEWAGEPDRPRDCNLGEAVVFSGAEYDRLTHGYSARMAQKGYKRLTISDLKPEENMKTHKTYQECKIANPEREVAVVARCDELTPPLGGFIAVFKSDDFADGYAFADQSKSGSPNISDGYYKVCNPSDHCMTVKEFLDAGYRFEVGDLYMTSFGRVEDVHDKDFCKIMNGEDDDGRDNIRYILRAAALEEKPRAKVEYVDVNANDNAFWEVAREFAEDGVEFRSSQDNRKINDNLMLLTHYSNRSLQRRIETPMTEREAFIELMGDFLECKEYEIELGNAFDSGKFKLVN